MCSQGHQQLQMDNVGLYWEGHHWGRGWGEFHKACCSVSQCITFDWSLVYGSAGVHFYYIQILQIAMPHQWLEGNLPVSAKCAVCDKTCGSVLRLQDWRCLWCKAMVRTTYPKIPYEYLSSKSLWTLKAICAWTGAHGMHGSLPPQMSPRPVQSVHYPPYRPQQHWLRR